MPDYIEELKIMRQNISAYLFTSGKFFLNKFFTVIAVTIITH